MKHLAYLKPDPRLAFGSFCMTGGADVNKRPAEDQQLPPLHLAVWARQKDVVVELLGARGRWSLFKNRPLIDTFNLDLRSTFSPKCNVGEKFSHSL